MTANKPPMDTAPTPTTLIQLPVLCSQAACWADLMDFVNDAAVDAMHHAAALHGAKLHVGLLISRAHLATHTLPPRALDRRIQTLCAALRHYGMSGTVDQVPWGNREPLFHELRISFLRNIAPF